VLVVDGSPRVLLEHAVEQLFDRVCSAPVIKFLRNLCALIFCLLSRSNLVRRKLA
jgi:hypothetical protein